MRAAIMVVSLLLALASPAFAAWPSDPAANLAVCTASRAQGSATIVADGSGGVFIAWDDRRADLVDDPENPIPDIYVHHILASGVIDPAWPTDGQVVSEAAGAQGGPQVLSDGAGGVLVVWGRHADLYAQHIFQNGTVDPAWPANGAAITSSGKAGTASIISDEAGGMILSWGEPRSGDFDVYAQHLTANGTVDPTWPSTGLIVATGPFVSERTPILTSDGAQGAIVTWSAGFRIFAHHILANGTVDATWGGARMLTTAPHPPYQWSPMPITDGAGGAIVTWYDSRNGNYDVFAQRIRHNGAIDPAWPTNGRALCSAPGSQMHPSIVSDDNGGAFVVWDDRRTSGSDVQWYADVYASHILGNGTVDPLWPVNGLPVCTANAPQWRVAMIPDGTGGAILAWDDFRNGNDDVYAQHVLPSGLDGSWPIDGAPVSIAPDHQEFPPQGGQTFLFAAATDGAGGSILTWTDFRSDSASDIYAQRIQGDGQLSPTASVPNTRPGFALRAVNPVIGNLEIMCSLPQSAPAQLAIFDVSGRKVLTRGFTSMRSGPTSVKLDKLPAGVYMIRLAQAGQSVTRRVVVLQ